MCLLYVFLLHSRPFYDKRMSAEVAADFLGDEWKVSCSTKFTRLLRILLTMGQFDKIAS